MNECGVACVSDRDHTKAWVQLIEILILIGISLRAYIGSFVDSVNIRVVSLERVSDKPEVRECIITKIAVQILKEDIEELYL